MVKSTHERTQVLMLAQKLLSLRNSISPLNLILDSPEQSARPLLIEYIRQARSLKSTIVYVSYETLKAPGSVDHFIKARSHSFSSLLIELKRVSAISERCMIVWDSTRSLQDQPNIAHTLSDIARSNASLVLVAHSIRPIDMYRLESYIPSQLKLLDHLATTVIEVQSIRQAKARRLAAEESKAEPYFGLDSGVEGSLVGSGANPKEGLILHIEHRRRSGRAIGLACILISSDRKSQQPELMLLGEHPEFHRKVLEKARQPSEYSETTFNLGLTTEQRQARESVVLPYHDIQTGGGQGGLILYEMSYEDDFDEEEDEI